MATLISANSNTTATAYTLATEVVAISSVDQVNTLDASQGMVIRATVSLTAGGTTGTVVARVRQGTGLAGAIVATVPLSNTVISVPNSFTFNVVDPAPLLVGAGNAGLPLYTVTLQVAGATATGSYAYIEVDQPTAAN